MEYETLLLNAPVMSFEMEIIQGDTLKQSGRIPSVFPWLKPNQSIQSTVHQTLNFEAFQQNTFF